MQEFNRKTHWESIYQTNALKDVGWYQPVPETSLAFFEEVKVPKTSKIIDIGGGDSLLVDHLLNRGYEDITVLDISLEAIQRAKQRLGEQAKHVQWMVSDIIDFEPEVEYDVWHDRASFHFLTSSDEAKRYVQIAHKALKPEAFLIIGVFSDKGPKKCSGIDIQQYSETDLLQHFSPYFASIRHINVDHSTPTGNVQNFVFGCFKKSE